MEVLNNQLCTKIFCVLPASSSEITCTEDLNLAKNLCQGHNLNVVCILENDCLKLTPSKECVFVLTEFDSPLFEFLQSFECKVVGPQCLLNSLKNGQPIPTTAVFNLAMKGIVVTTTGLTMQEKKEAEKKIQFMGGIYTSNLTVSTTHLIAKSVSDFGLKFKAVRSRAIPIMLPKWIDEVWSARISQEIVHGNDPKYSSYVCPVFQGFVICTSQISTKERESIKKTVEANGGKYSAQLKKGETNVLITTSCEGDKYLYARSWKIFCLKPEWVQNSLDQGYVCDPEPFTVQKITTLPPKCSTPEANKLPVANFHNDSVNSTIFNNSTKELDETSTNGSTSPLNQQCELQSTEPLECLDLVLSLKAGRFLKGFKIFPSGFDGPQMEKLRRVLKNAGAIQLNAINDESISHVIVGKSVKEDWKQLQHLDIKPNVVTLQWLAHSLLLKAPAPEAEYFPTDFENLLAPNNKKSLSKDTPIELPSMTTSVSLDDMRTTVQYSSLSQKTTLMECVTEQNNNCDQEKDLQTAFENLTIVDQTEEDKVQKLLEFSPAGDLFSGASFQLVSLLDTVSSMTYQIESNGGHVVSYGAKYIVTEPLYTVSLPEDLVEQGSQLVNTFWIEDCIEEDLLVQKEIYHLPIKVQNRRVFACCIVSFSGIRGRLMEFLEYLIDQLGGKQQKFLSRKLAEKKHIYPSTHLVCMKAEGKKYEKAVEWGIPIVNVDWIIACASSSTRPKEIDYPPEVCEATTPTDLVIPTPITVVKISRPSVVTDSSTPIFLPNISFGAPSPHVLMGPPTTPLLSIDPIPSPVFLLPPSNGTRTFGISPTPRPALSNMPTPETPYGRLLNPNPSPECRKLWKFALDNRIRLTPKPEDSFSASPPQPSESGCGITMSMALECFQRLHQRILEDNSCETIEVANDADASTLPVLKLPLLHDVLAFISHDIGSKYDRTELMEIVGTLGGRVCIEHCQEVTHFVCQGELAVSEEMRKAKEWNQIFILPQWILDCEDSSCRLEEGWSCYQPPLNFETIVSSDVAPVSSSLLEITNDEQQNLPNRPDEEENTLQVEQTVTQQISFSSDAVARKGFEPDDVSGNLNLLPAPLPNSSFARVTKNLNQSHRLNASRYHGNLFRVMFSGMDQEDRDSYIQIIETLGGIAIDSHVYDATCTHLVVAKLECNDKLMTSIAAGKWIVHPGWIEESEEAYRFVDERKFEWGSSTSNVSISKEEASIAAAAYHWRTSRNRGLFNGPFQGISAVLHLGKKNDVFQNLLEAGGGKMVAPELALESVETNFCVLDSHEVNKIQLSEYASKGIYCVPPTYFRDLILALDEKLQMVECVLPEFLPYLNLTLSSRI